MTCADPKDESPRVLRLEAGERLGHRGGGRRPDVHDAGADDEGGRRLEEAVDQVELGGRRCTEPQRRVAEPFQFASDLRRNLSSGVRQMVTRI